MKRPVIAIAIAIAAVAPIAQTAQAQENGCPVGQYLTQGRRGSDDVRCLQATLNSQGFNSGPVDGWFGPITEGAVVAYQQAKGLIVDGEVGRQTGGSLGIWSTSPTPAQQAEGRSTAPSSGGGTVWDRLAQCESGGNWSINTGNGYYGGLQFGMPAWRATGGSGRPDQASRGEQIARAEILLDMQGWGAWPACSRKLGLR